MIILAKKKKVKEDFDYAALVRNRKLPILTLDSRWHKIYENKKKDARIRKLEDDLNSKIKQQGKVNTDLKELGKLKKKLMSEIVNNMGESSNSKQEILRQKKLGKSKRFIEEINSKVENYENQKLELPSEIRRANEALMVATAEQCYEQILDNEVKLKELTEWIEKTRTELKRRIIIKQEMEEHNENMYSYLHDMLGPEFMQIFDERHRN